MPEHFNLPWHLAIEEGAFEARGIDLQWTDIPEGTGRMCQMLQAGHTDLAIILTEGIIKSISEGNSARIVQEYIATPLHWGIHVAANGPYQHLGDLVGKTAAISRYGSGSHLMSYVLAESVNWPMDGLHFQVVNTIDGAVEALTQGTADFFLWERFTTKPLVDQGVFRRLGDCPTPWPCFVIAATNDFVREHKGILQHILDIINNYTLDFREIPCIDKTLANRYGQQLEDIREWLGMTRWSQKNISNEIVDNVQDKLLYLKLISTKMNSKDIIHIP